MSEDLENSTVAENATAEEQQVVNRVPDLSPAQVPDPMDTSADWLSEDLVSQSNLKDFKTPDDLAKSYIELQRLVGSSVRIPGEDASPEAKQEFLNKIKDIDGVILQGDENLYSKLGRPEEPTGYEISIEDSIHEVLPDIDVEVDDFRAIAHEIGLTQDQAEKLVGYRMKTIESQIEHQQMAREQAEQELHKLWGQDYNNRLEGAKQTLKVLREKHGDAIDDLINGPAGNNVAFLHMASELGNLYKEKGHEGMGNAQFGLTPEMAKSKIAEKESDPGFKAAYRDAFHPQHKQAVAEMRRLHLIAAGQSEN